MKKYAIALGLVGVLVFNGAAHAGIYRTFDRDMIPIPGKGAESVSGSIQFRNVKRVDHWITLHDDCNAAGQGDGYGAYFVFLRHTPSSVLVSGGRELTSGCGTSGTWGEDNDAAVIDGAARNLQGVSVMYGLTDAGTRLPQGQICLGNYEYADNPIPSSCVY